MRLPLGIGLAVLPALASAAPGAALSEPGAIAPSGPCFDVALGFEAPLREPVRLLAGRDHSEHGTRADGMDWAATRAQVDLPIRQLVDELLDPRNLKAMEKTRLLIRERPDERVEQLQVSAW